MPTLIPQAQPLRQYLDAAARVAAATEPSAGPHPPHCPAFEDAASADQEAVDTLIANCAALEESAFDHAAAIVRGLTEPVQVYSLFTCARAVLECCSTALWIIDRDSDAAERMRRSLMLRYWNVDEQRKLAESSGDSSVAKHAAARLQRIVTRAAGLGILTKPGDPPIILGPNPGTTQIVAHVFDAEAEFRILSGAAHGLPTYLRELGMKAITTDRRVLEKSLSPAAVNFVTQGPLCWFAKLACALRDYRGLPSDALTRAAQMARAQLGIPADAWP